MVTSELKSASGLHMLRGMKAVAVVIVAMLALTGCGVGEGEYWDGEKLVSAKGEALEFDSGPEPSVSDAPAPQLSITTGTDCTGAKNPGLISLPQDPIPVQPYPLDAMGLPILPPGMPPVGTPPRPKY